MKSFAPYPLFALGLLLIASVRGPALFAEESFHIFAPSRETGNLLVVEAKQAADGLTLTEKQKVDLGFLGTSIVSHPDKPILYVAAVRAPEDQDADMGALVTLGDDGRVLRHSPVHLKHPAAYLSLDRQNRFLLAASYFDGHVDVYPLNADGIPGDPVTSLFEGHPFAHCVLPSPDNRFVYIPYVKEHNALYQYRFDPESGSLAPLETKNAKPPEGTGPRHMAYHPNKPVVYFSNEQHLGVSVYERQDSGALKLLQVCDAVDPGEPRDGVSSSDIAITPDGKFLFAGIRGHQRDFDRISRYRITETGEVELLGLTPADKIPWGLALSPGGEYLLVSAFQGGTLNAYRIGEDGGLVRKASLPCDKQISDLVTRSFTN